MKYTLIIETSRDDLPPETVEALTRRAIAGAFDDHPPLGHIRLDEFLLGSGEEGIL